MSKIDKIVEYMYSKRVVKCDDENYLDVSKIFTLHYNKDKNTILITTAGSTNHSAFTYISVEKFIKANPELGIKWEE